MKLIEEKESVKRIIESFLGVVHSWHLSKSGISRTFPFSGFRNRYKW